MVISMLFLGDICQSIERKARKWPLSELNDLQQEYCLRQFPAFLRNF